MLKKNMDDLDKTGTIGDWCFLNSCTKIAIRYAEDPFTGTVTVPTSPTIPGHWDWDGNREAPTLSPSIYVHPYPGVTAGWHGWLREGKLVTA